MRNLGIIAAVIISAGFQAANAQVMHSAFDAVTDSAVFYPPTTRATGDLLNRRMDTNVSFMNNTGYDGFVSSFKAKNQDDGNWSAEQAGKLLESMALAWPYTKNATLKTRLDDYAGKLVATQLSDGYLSNYAASYRFQGWDMWNQKYVMIGMLLYYQATGDTAGLHAARRMGEWLHDKYFATSASDFTNNWWGGLNSISATWAINDLYRLTGEQQIQDLCASIMNLMQTSADYWQNNSTGLINLTQDTGTNCRFAGWKAYETFGSICGVVGQYRIAGNPKYLKTGENAWYDITRRHLYPTGQFAQNEEIADDFNVSWTANGAEACATFQWLILNWELFRVTGNIKYADEMERTIYNALIGGQNPRNGECAYDVNLTGNMDYMGWASPSEPRAIARIPWYSVGLFRGNPMISLYLPGTWDLPVKVGAGTVNTTMRIVTDYPASGNVTATLTPASASTFTLRLRVPWWCKNYRATAGGQVYTATQGQFLDISRTWQPGDQVSIVMQMPYRVETYGYGNYPGKIYAARGPQVLATSSAVSGTTLPSGWVGNQVYNIQKSGGGSIVMVPYADAGQTGNITTVFDAFGVVNPPVNAISGPIATPSAARPLERIASTDGGLRIECNRAGLHCITVCDALGNIIAAFSGTKPASYRVARSSGAVCFVTVTAGADTRTQRVVVR
jgi:hypothetical protein